MVYTLLLTHNTYIKSSTYYPHLKFNFKPDAAGTRPDFLKLILCRSSVCVGICVCVCVSAPRLLITSGVIWTPYDWLNKFYSCYMATVVIIVNGRGFGIDTRRRH